MMVRKPSFIEMVVQAFLCAFLLLLVVDYLVAAKATACSSLSATQGCYPWGTEAGSWTYANKEIYLGSLLVWDGIVATAILSPFAMPGIWTGLVAVAIILAAGFYSAEWVTGFLL
ncbi:hypothetical protein [Neorhizobium galegae]|uniref:hypothetical protein n=1 Tax=Neorhizobium galegae TaxID=399 RepID=UPI000620EC79|nr:hypothetical protein [Neorhizobium galegae]CDZ29514.1 Hypothetical protein NGAL_HAMBI490_43810 [Neorhizobium galegae bv. officinalis]KAA9386268.1 hypothetical protein F4V88_07170 [Neorhizobium galegae]MCM2500670.1 hypothetical protein [Neorhizobium galegae]MCQ1770629.1 hypothetical protein [Neorhizobium galegae]MCQ1777533.1 hypothetical protein [Neorhizobium galegae]